MECRFSPAAYRFTRGDILVGGIGVSGDGIQQDTLIAFLGVEDGPITLNNAPANIRADQLSAGGVLLRYNNCPPSPFLNSNEPNACLCSHGGGLLCGRRR